MTKPKFYFCKNNYMIHCNQPYESWKQKQKHSSGDLIRESLSEGAEAGSE